MLDTDENQFRMLNLPVKVGSGHCNFHDSVLRLPSLDVEDTTWCGDILTVAVSIINLCLPPLPRPGAGSQKKGTKKLKLLPPNLILKTFTCYQ